MEDEESGDCLASCMRMTWFYVESEDLKVMVGRFAEVCRRRGLRVVAGKSGVMVLSGGEGLECEVNVDGVYFGRIRHRWIGVHWKGGEQE